MRVTSIALILAAGITLTGYKLVPSSQAIKSEDVKLGFGVDLKSAQELPFSDAKIAFNERCALNCRSTYLSCVESAAKTGSQSAKDRCDRQFKSCVNAC